MLFPSEIFYEMVAHNYQINNLRLVNKDIYNACSSDHFWLNMKNNYTQEQQKDEQFLQKIKKIYAFANSINNTYTIIGIKMFYYDALLQKHFGIPYCYHESYETLHITIKNNIFTLKISLTNTYSKKTTLHHFDISQTTFFQFIFDCYKHGKSVRKFTYIKL